MRSIFAREGVKNGLQESRRRYWSRIQSSFFDERTHRFDHETGSIDRYRWIFRGIFHEKIYGNGRTYIGFRYRWCRNKIENRISSGQAWYHWSRLCGNVCKRYCLCRRWTIIFPWLYCMRKKWTGKDRKDRKWSSRRMPSVRSCIDRWRDCRNAGILSGRRIWSGWIFCWCGRPQRHDYRKRIKSRGCPCRYGIFRYSQ